MKVSSGPSICEHVDQTSAMMIEHQRMVPVLWYTIERVVIIDGGRRDELSA
jgi:hypothetical protein